MINKFSRLIMWQMCDALSWIVSGGRVFEKLLDVNGVSLTLDEDLLLHVHLMIV